MSTTTQPPDITAHLDAAERAATPLLDALRTALNAVPDELRFSPLRASLVGRIALAARAGDNAHERALLAEMARPKGPMVDVTVPSRLYGPSTVRHEIAEITTHAIVLHNGARYSRKTGNRINYVGGQRPPYITEAERARVLALPRPPAPARPRKEPRP